MSLESRLEAFAAEVLGTVQDVPTLPNWEVFFENGSSMIVTARNEQRARSRAINYQREAVNRRSMSLAERSQACRVVQILPAPKE